MKCSIWSLLYCLFLIILECYFYIFKFLRGLNVKQKKCCRVYFFIYFERFLFRKILIRTNPIHSLFPSWIAVAAQQKKESLFLQKLFSKVDSSFFTSFFSWILVMSSSLQESVFIKWISEKVLTSKCDSQLFNLW